MEDWAQRALQRWPNVPALFGWLGLNRRGQWLIRGETISRPQIIDTINRNYEADRHGRWFFQNGPQRGFIALQCTPFVLRVEQNRLVTHTQLPAAHLLRVLLDEEGSIVIETEHGPGTLVDHDLEWVLARLRIDGREVDADALEAALALPSGNRTPLTFTGDGLQTLPVGRMDRDELPRHFGFVRDPEPLAGEVVSTRVAD